MTWNTIEDSRINGSVWITNYNGFWQGFFRNTVNGSVNYNNNTLVDPDGNEVQTNTIHGNLNCSGNDPAPQQGDSEGSPNVVTGQETGQCVGVEPYPQHHGRREAKPRCLGERLGPRLFALGPSATSRSPARRLGLPPEPALRRRPVGASASSRNLLRARRLDVEDLSPVRFILEHGLEHRLGLGGRSEELDDLMDLV